MIFAKNILWLQICHFFIWRRSWQYLDVSGKFLLLKRNNRLKTYSLKIMCTTRWSNSRACQRLMKGDNCTSAYRATLSFQLSFLGSPSKLNPKWVLSDSMVTTRNLQLVHRDNASELSVVKARMRRIVEMCQSLLWSFEFCQKIKMFFCPDKTTAATWRQPAVTEGEDYF